MMSKTVWRISIVAALLAGLFAQPPAVSACSCMQPPTPAGAFQQVDAVFVGTVTSIADAGQFPLFTWVSSRLPQNLSDAFYGRRISMAVTQSWRGVTTTRVTIRSGYGGGDCGYSFAIGGQYVVYAYQYQNNLSTGICNRTAPTSQAASDLQYLQSLSQLTLRPTFPWPVVSLSVGLLGVLGAGLIVWRWRRTAISKRNN